MVQLIYTDEYAKAGKTTFKEEFVTAGGVALSDVSLKTMESKVCPGMYFAGELFRYRWNYWRFQFSGCLTTGFVAGKLVK